MLCWISYCSQLFQFNVKCEICKGRNHPTALHVVSDSHRWQKSHGGEQAERTFENDAVQNTEVKPYCTQICGKSFAGKSCAKTVLVRLYSQSQPSKEKICYAMIDDQSNQSLATPLICDFFKDNCTQESTYLLSTCSGQTRRTGRKMKNVSIESYDGSHSFRLPDVLECDQIPDVRNEIPTPDVASHYPHLRDIEPFIPPLTPDAQIVLLIGRDLIEAHHVLDQRIGPPNSPYAQKLPLGWTIIGETCLGKVHRPNAVNVMKTNLTSEGRVTLFNPCINSFAVREDNPDPFRVLGENVFLRTESDDKPGLSTDDRKFLDIMNKGFHKTAEGNWSAPLPFRDRDIKIPNNKPQAEKRAKTLESS